MIRLSRESRLVRFAYLGNVPHGFGEPIRTSLCALFWRCVRSGLVALVAGVALVGLAVAIKRDPGGALFIGGILVIAIVICAVGEAIKQWRIRRRATRKPAPPPSVAREAFRAVKERVCPLVEIES